MNTDPRDSTARRSRALFENGYCCSESVLFALAEHTGHDPETLVALASGFCGGIAGTRRTCGAVSGAIMGLGLALGPVEPGADHATVEDAARHLMQRFQAAFGSLACGDLLSGIVAAEVQQPGATCADYVGEATRLALDALEDAQ